MFVIHPVTRSVVDAEFRYPLPTGATSPGLPSDSPPNPSQDTHPRIPVPDVPEPTGVDIRLVDLEHPLDCIP